MGAEGCQDFGLLALRDLEDVQGPSEFRCDLIEFCGGDPEVPVGLLKAEGRCAGLGGCELEGSTRSVADPQRPHELEAGQPFQVLRMPFPQLRVLGLLADDRVLHDGVTEVIHHRRDGEDAAQTLVQSFLRRGLLGLGVCIVRPIKAMGAALSASAATAPRLVIDVVERCAIAELLGYGGSGYVRTTREAVLLPWMQPEEKGSHM